MSANTRTVNRRWWEREPSFWRTVGWKGVGTSIVATFILAFVPATHADWGKEVKLSTNETSASLNENMGHCLLANGDTLHAVWMDIKGAESAIHYRRSVDRGVPLPRPIRVCGTRCGTSSPKQKRRGCAASPRDGSVRKVSTDGVRAAPVEGCLRSVKRVCLSGPPAAPNATDELLA